MLSQVEWPEWLEKSMMNMNINIFSNTNDQILNIPSQLAIINNEHVHYYVNDGGEEEHPVDTKDGREKKIPMKQ